MSKTNPILVPNDIGSMNLTPSARKHLENTLRNLESGRAPTPSFKLYGSTSVDVVEKFIHDMAGKHLVPQFVVDYELSRLGKFGGQGGYPKWSDVEDMFLLYKTNPKPVRYVDKEIIREMTRDYAQLRCSMYSVDSALEHLKKTEKIEDRAAGDPTFDLKKTDPEAQRIAKRYAKSKKYLQLRGYTFEKWQKQKARIFMPMPFASMIKQAQYFIPFLENIQSDVRTKGTNSSFVAWADKIGFEQCFKLLEKEIREAMRKYPGKLVWYKTDFEKMDTHTATSQYKEFFIPMLDAAFHQHFPDMEEAMLFTTNAPIISPSGTMIGDHGTASGAEVTNGGECCGNDYYQRRFLKILRQLCDKLSIKFHFITRRLNGDDGIFAFILEDETRFSEFNSCILRAAQQAADETQFAIQVEKQEVSTEMTTYCQIMLWWEDDKLCYGYPCALCLNSIINPWREYTPAQWDKDYRDIDIVEKLDGVYGHPWYRGLVVYVDKGMKYPLLGSSEKETSRILAKYDKYRSLQPIGERFNRQDYHISNSHTVVEVLQLRGRSSARA